MNKEGKTIQGTYFDAAEYQLDVAFDSLSKQKFDSFDRSLQLSMANSLLSIAENMNTFIQLAKLPKE